MKTKNRSRHPYKWFVYNGRNIRIDKEIAPLISKMWKLGILTISSCQAVCSFNCIHKNINKLNKKTKEIHTTIIPTKHCYNNVWIAFDSCLDIELFYDIVAKYDSKNDSMYSKIKNFSFFKKKFISENWSCIFPIKNLGIKGHWGRPTINGKRLSSQVWIEDRCKKNDFCIQPQLTFPRKHLPYVEERLDLAIKDIKK